MPMPRKVSDTRPLLFSRASRAARQLVDQAADTALVLAIGTLERGDLVVDQRLQLAGPADRPRDGVVHRRDLAADRLAERGDLLLGEPVGLGEPHGDLRHGRGHQPHRLGAPSEIAEEPENMTGTMMVASVAMMWWAWRTTPSSSGQRRSLGRAALQPSTMLTAHQTAEAMVAVRKGSLEGF
ncbi:MAG: hypothetical protein R3D33_14740 [Hyphomicrobiaceae bacterium]